MNLKIVLAALLLVVFSFYSFQYLVSDGDRWTQVGYPVTNDSCQIIHNTGFSLGYSDKYKQARWLMYRLKWTQLQGTTEKTTSWAEDPKLITASTTKEDYKKSGYVKGQLCPYQDMKWSSNGLAECYYFTNVVPIIYEFDNGIWSRLEYQVRKWAKANKEVYIVTGGHLKDGLDKIGVNQITAPKWFYKVVLDYREPDIKAIGFLMPNRKIGKHVKKFVVSVDSIESLTGIDFFPNLPDDIEQKVESNVNINRWPWY